MFTKQKNYTITRIKCFNANYSAHCIIKTYLIAYLGFLDALLNAYFNDCCHEFLDTILITVDSLVSETPSECYFLVDLR